MPGQISYKMPVIITSVEHKSEIVEQYKGPTEGSVRSVTRDLGWFAHLEGINFSMRISDVDPNIKPGTRAFLNLVVPVE